MADLKISELNALASSGVAADDLVAVVDTSATETKKMTAAQLRQVTNAGNAVNALDYGLSTAGTAAANTTALRNAVEAACTGSLALFIPAGVYNVAHNCLAPTTTTAEYSGLTVFGEGMYSTELRMERDTANSYFFDNSTGGASYFRGGTPTGYSQHLRRAKFLDLSFTGGPTSTSEERNNVNDDCWGFRLFGASDQNFRFTRCRFQTMTGVFEAWGHNNASEIGFVDCFISHIYDGHVIVMDNLQALNWFFWNCDVENISGSTCAIIKSVDSSYGSVGGGGSVGVFGGSWILSNLCAVVRVLNSSNVTSVVNFYGTRFELRDYGPGCGTFVDGSAGGLLTVNANGSNFTTIPTSGGHKMVDIKANQFVGYTRCTFEHNGSYATYTNNGGRLVFNECAVRSTIQSEVTTTGGGVSKAKDCYERFNFPNTIEWVE